MSELDALVDRLRAGQRFIISSHQRPDGDAIGSAMGAAFALRAIGKQVDVVFDAPPPHFLQPFPGVEQLRVATRVDQAYDAAVIMECGSLDRTGVAGLDLSPVLNIDHHLGNTRYGQVNWIDESAAACTELVFTLVERLGAPLTREVATHIYLGILTDTGSFHFSHMTPRTFDIARRAVEAGADPQWIARTHYDSSTLGRVRIFGAVLNGMELDPSGQVAVLTITEAMASAAGATYDDTEGLINFPLTVKDIQAVAFFKEMNDGSWRVGLRSKGNVDVRAIASQFGGGGHVNAAGCSATGELTALRDRFMQLLVKAAAATPDTESRA
jgi:phosphoesterase RecJ-like protein